MMKRSASENSLLDPQGNPAMSSLQQQKMSRQWAWGEGSVQQAAMGYNFQNEANLFGRRHYGVQALRAPSLVEEEDEEGEGGAGGSGQAKLGEYRGSLDHSIQGEGTAAAAGGGGGGALTSTSSRGRRNSICNSSTTTPPSSKGRRSLGLRRSYASSQQLSSGASDVASSRAGGQQGGDPFFSTSSTSSPKQQQQQQLPQPHQQQEQLQQQQQQLGLPRVSTAPLLQELGETLNNHTARNLEAMKLVIHNAQLSVQQTASNCQQNLQTLSNLFQHNLQVSTYLL